MGLENIGEVRHHLIETQVVFLLKVCDHGL